MLKLITYYRSNASHKLAFYGKGTKRNSQKFSDNELNTIINEALAEWPEFEDDDDEIAMDMGQNIQRTTNEHIILNHRVMYEAEDKKANDNVDENNQNDNEVAGRGILNYNVDDLAKEFED
ncbi:hypothetical protein RclHR1_06880006 [Rhizophagus clarus]|uniref:Uncharacterized protein n=1 Tax=Rhizophagus clarus TaxID=94130 RepID=A0A2Z6SK11_9GLOM|nr:hypothetical protein RclHR1_06880006 [Rhizophagus clarus]